jgi:Sulfotransferase family
VHNEPPAARRVDISDPTEQREAFLSPADPVFILAPPCTFSWAICGMLGQHPQMYGFPELHLFSAETMAGWWDICFHENYQMDHGLARTVADLYFGGQTDYAIARARGWLRRRAHYNTGFLFEVLAERLKPLVPVEKSPSIIYRAEFMTRAFNMFPGARFIHLVSHPATFCETVTEALRELSLREAMAPTHWLVQLTTFPRHSPGELPKSPAPDPQVGWYSLHKSIIEFLDRVPPEQKRTVRGEDLLSDSNSGLLDVASWLRLSTDSGALEEMRHPERSRFASYGPASAPFGSDLFLVPGPIFRQAWTEPRSLEGPVRWRSDGQDFFQEVRDLAVQFGYQ